MSRWLKHVRWLLASLLGAAPAAEAARVPEAQASAPDRAASMGRLFREMAEDEALRARFAADPVGVMRARGLDPEPLHLSERLNAARLDRVVRDFADPLAAPLAAPGPAQRVAEGPAAPVYGPPAAPEPPPPRPVSPPPRDEASPPRDAPPHGPVAVYGPPPTPLRPPDRR